MFSIAPLLLIVIAVAGLIFGADAARGEILVELQGLLGKDGAHAVESLLKSVSEPAKSTGAAMVGIVVLLSCYAVSVSRFKLRFGACSTL